MSKTSNKELYFYYFKIFMEMDGSVLSRCEQMKLVRDAVGNYIIDHPQKSIEEVQIYFGPPKKVATCYKSVEGEVVKGKEIRQKIKRTILWTLLGLFTLFLIFCLTMFLLHQVTVPTYVK